MMEQSRVWPNARRIWTLGITLVLFYLEHATGMPQTIRLAGSEVQHAGRVEVLRNGRWGTVCDNTWDIDTAHVVCRELGFSGAILAPCCAAFGAGIGQVNQLGVICRGNETRLGDCPSDKTTDNVYCRGHFEDAGVVCKAKDASDTAFKVRLQGSGEKNAGRVEVRYQGVWGTVDYVKFYIKEAHVVCRQLGFPRAIAVYSSATYGAGTGPVWMSSVNCTGNQTSLNKCSHAAWGSASSRFRNDVGVECLQSESAVEPEAKLRLIGGPVPHAGQVEIFYNNSWRGVCDYGWTRDDARVVCRQLGYPDVIATACCGVFGARRGPYWLTNIGCRGDESKLTQCPHPGWGKGFCFSALVGVVCKPKNASSLGFQIRLQGKSATTNRGLVEIKYTGIWGSVASTGWDIRDGNVVCKQLKYKKARAVYFSSFNDFNTGGFVGITGSWSTQLRCYGNESSFAQCLRSEDVRLSSLQYRSVEVECTNDTGPERTLSVRLVGGNQSHAGNVEVLYNSRWLKLCGSLWRKENADVVCRQLGYPGALLSLNDYDFTTQTRVRSCFFCRQRYQMLRINNLRCHGGENSLALCPHAGFSDTSLCFNAPAGVICRTSPQGGDSLQGIRLTGAPVPGAGRVELKYGGIWGTVCSTNWEATADVICRQLGYKRAVAALRFSLGQQNSGPIWLNHLNCNGSETSITDCSNSGLGNTDIFGCGFRALDPSVVCGDEAAKNIRIRLAGTNRPGSYAGRVEINLAGLWGTLHHDAVDFRAADVLCRMAGYSRGAVTIYTNARFGRGAGVTWLTQTKCTGRETSILDCPGLQWSRNQRAYFHGQDASIECRRPGVSYNDTKLRLVQGPTKTSGYLEVNINNQWVAVCDRSWNKKNADVACRQMGFSGSLAGGWQSQFQWKYTQGRSDNAREFTDIQCKGYESSLDQCPRGGRGRNDPDYCRRYRAAVVCRPPGFDITDMQIRLGGNTGRAVGRVEIRYSGVWGRLCANFYFPKSAADVVCRTLGFKDAVTSFGFNNWYDQGVGPLWPTSFSCTGSEQNLTDCHRAPVDSCLYAGYVACRTNSTSGRTLQDFDVRLVNGSNSYSGRVEIKYAGAWGTVSDVNWDIRDGHVVCKQLGFKGAVGVYTQARYGQGRGPIWISNANCNGNETKFADCLPPSWENTISAFSSHARDASVVCNNGVNEPNIKLRLVGSNRNNSGNVEVSYQGVWGQVCLESRFSVARNFADVACRELGFTQGALTTFRENRFTLISSRNAAMVGVRCGGFERSLSQCAFRGWGSPSRVYRCSSFQKLNVICKTGNPSLDEPKIRLAGTNSSHAGRVEIQIGGAWGRVCSFGWSKADADVACRWLGFPGAHLQFGWPMFGFGSGPVLLSQVRCRGTESTLMECFNLPSSSFCFNGDVGVVCRSNETELPTKFRLVDGPVPFAGRVEIRYAGIWGTINDRNFDFREGQVICRLLGYSGVASVIGNARYGQGSGPIWLSNVHCLGNETTFGQCPDPGFPKSRRFNSHLNDASLECLSDNTSVGVSVRLAGSSASHAGRVEMYYKGQWGSICDRSWDIQDAHVVCRELGFPRALLPFCCGVFGEASGPVLTTRVRCTGLESSLAQCQHRGFGAPTRCSHSQDAGVICEPNDNTSFALEVRLGRTNLTSMAKNAGRIEIRSNGVWGTVCGKGWNKNASDVICKQLGYPDGAVTEVYNTTPFGRGDGPIWYSFVSCKGDEDSIVKCRNLNWRVSNRLCNHDDDIGVVCKSRNFTTDGRVRLQGAKEANAGRVEIQLGGVWGTVQDLAFDIRDARVACRQLGYEGAIGVYNRARYGQGTGPIWLSNMVCTGNENSLAGCSHSTLGQGASHIYDVSVECHKRGTTPPAVPIRLQGTEVSHAGRVEVMYQKEWGTVCSDDSWDRRDAAVVCRQLQYGPPLVVMRGGAFGAGTGRTWMNGVRCQGWETQLSHCSHRGWESTRVGGQCSGSTGASVVCTPRNFDGKDVSVRIVSSTVPNEGRVEVRFAGVWAPLCVQRSLTNIQAARVVCRQLGYGRGYYFAARSQTRLPPLRRPLYPTALAWTTNINCRGDEASLSECSQRWRFTQCSGVYPNAPVEIKCRPKVQPTEPTPSKPTPSKSSPSKPWCDGTCKNGGRCRPSKTGYQCVCEDGYGGEICQAAIENNNVTLVFNMELEKFDTKEFRNSVAKEFTEYCKDNDCTITNRDSVKLQRRSVVSFEFHASDVIIVPGYPKATMGNTLVVVMFVVMRPGDDTGHVIEANTLNVILQAVASDIDKSFGSVAYVNAKPFTAVNQKQNPSPGSGSEAKVALAVIIPVIIIALLASLSIWYWRRKRGRFVIPRHRFDNTLDSTKASGFSDPDSPDKPNFLQDFPDLSESQLGDKTFLASDESGIINSIYDVSSGEVRFDKAKEEKPTLGKNNGENNVTVGSPTDEETGI